MTTTQPIATESAISPAATERSLTRLSARFGIAFTACRSCAG